MIEYPKRKPFFLARVVRLLTKSAAAMEIGPEGVSLVVIIVGQEDACRYTRPVNFWNTQLAPLVGLRDPEALRRVRERCVKSGWLQYMPGNKQQPARYFVTIPDAVSLLPDSGSDESPREYDGDTAPIQTLECRESAENLPRICRESAENLPRKGQPPCLSLPLNPSPPPNATTEEGLFDGDFKAPVNTKPLTVTGADLFTQLRGMLKSFGKDQGIACLDAALALYDHQTITNAIKAAFQDSQAQIQADDILGVISARTAAQRPKIDTPERLPPMIDLEALKNGIMRPARSA